MGAQSLVIGKMFGEGFQYGKRKISAMPNEEFNKLTFEAMMSNARSEMQASIPTMQKALQDMKPMVETVVHEFTNYLSLVISEAPKQAEQVLESLKDASGFTELNDKLVKLIADAKGQSQSQDVLGDILVALGLERFGQSAGGVDMTEVTAKQTIPLTGFQGPEINPATGEQSTFLTALQKAKSLQGAAHIPTKVMSNVSLQSLTLERKILQQKIATTAVAQKNAMATFNQTKSWSIALKTKKNHIIAGYQKNVSIATQQLISAQQKFADFMKRHGHRF